MVFLMSTNAAPSVGRKSMRVGSRIVDWEGEVMAEVDDGIARQCTAILDVEGLRKRRSDPDIALPAPRGFLDVNYLSRFRVEVCRVVYNSTSLYPANTFKDGTVSNVRATPEAVAGNFKTSIGHMVDAGLISPKYVKA